MRLVRPLLFVAAMLVASLLSAAGASAASFSVTSLENDGSGSLRAAIQASNDPSVGDTISITVTGQIKLQTPLPPITDDVTIVGPGADSLTVERGVPTHIRIFDFANVDATVRDLTVSGGIDEVGGGILNSGGDLTLVRVVVTGNEALNESGTAALATGGGIYSNGPLTLRESFIWGNRAFAHGGNENVAAGGGVEAADALTVERSTISFNLVQAFAEGGSRAYAEGGGLLLTSGPVSIDESTVSDNAAVASHGIDETFARGGGIQASTVTFTSSTLAGNEVEIVGGGTTSFAGGSNVLALSAVVRNTIVAHPQGDASSCLGGFSSGGFNLDEDGSCEFEESSDLVDVAAGLDPVLRDNGGPTPTHALLPGSIAIDRGNSFGAAVDQRGLPRPSDFPDVSNKEGGDGSDIGAFELQAPPPLNPAPARVAEVAADRTPPNTRIVRGPARLGFKRLAKFRFASTEPQSTFQCKLDRKKWKACANPFKRSVKPGRHRFKVRAIDRFGNVDPSPARFGWRVKPLS
jgi:hypothetical protein